MKKRNWFALLLVIGLTLTGCGKKENDSEIIDNARKKMNALSSYAMTMDISMGIKSGGFEMNMPFTIAAKLDNVSKNAKMDIAIEVFGMSIETESYVDASGEQTITYTKEVMEDAWTKSYSENTGGLQDFASITENSTKIEKKKSNDKTLAYYQITISKDKMQTLLNESMNAMDSTDAYVIEKDVVVDIYIDKKTNYITKMEMNLLDVMTIDDEDAELTEFKMSITFSQFDEIGTITIPAEVIENAVEEESY